MHEVQKQLMSWQKEAFEFAVRQLATKTRTGLGLDWSILANNMFLKSLLNLQKHMDFSTSLVHQDFHKVMGKQNAW